jgi:hypothetical protein
MRYLRRGLEFVRQYRKPYFILCACFYGLVAGGMVYAAFDRGLQSSLTNNAREGVTAALPHVAAAYAHGQILAAMGLTFVVNYFLASILCIVVPSLIVPFSGLAIGGVRAFMWGLVFSPTSWPTSAGSAMRGALVLGLLILEGLGFILAMLAAYVQGANFLNRGRTPHLPWRRRYWSALKQSVPLYWLVALQLAVAAAYESILVIKVLPLLK